MKSNCWQTNEQQESNQVRERVNHWAKSYRWGIQLRPIQKEFHSRHHSTRIGHNGDVTQGHRRLNIKRLKKNHYRLNTYHGIPQSIPLPEHISFAWLTFGTQNRSPTPWSIGKTFRVQKRRWWIYSIEQFKVWTENCMQAKERVWELFRWSALG